MKIGKNCVIGANFKNFGNGEVIFKNNVKIGDDVTFNISERLVIGDRSIIGDKFILEGRDIELGTEFWSGHDCQIGGGSCFEKNSKLRIGYWCHLGNFSFINTSRSVEIGNEVGMGTGTKIYTHGAYLSFLDGFPVEFGSIKIGNNVWFPGAIILPNVEIGDNVVVGVGSIVTKNIPSGSLAMGAPAKVIRENYYPKKTTVEDKKNMIDVFIQHFYENIIDVKAHLLYDVKKDVLILDNNDFGITRFNISKKQIHGKVSLMSEKLRNELRRYGVRFKSYPNNGEYSQW